MTSTADRLQEKKRELETLANREPIIHSDNMDETVLTQFQSQLTHIFKQSQKTLRELIKKIKDDLNEEEIQALAKEIDDALASLTASESKKIQAAHETSLAIAQCEENLHQERLAAAAQPVETPIMPLEPPEETPVIPSTPSAAATLTNFIGGFFKRAPAAPQEPPKNIAPMPEKNPPNEKAEAAQKAFEQKTVLFKPAYPDEDPNQPLATSRDEKTPEPVIPITKVARKKARRVNTEELTPRTPTKKAN